MLPAGQPGPQAGRAGRRSADSPVRVGWVGITTGAVVGTVRSAASRTAERMSPGAPSDARTRPRLSREWPPVDWSPSERCWSATVVSLPPKSGGLCRQPRSCRPRRPQEPVRPRPAPARGRLRPRSCPLWPPRRRAPGALRR